MPDLFGKKQLGRATTGGRFYATPSERVESGAVYFPDESSLLFGVAEYTVEAGNLGAFATEGTFIFEKLNDWIDNVGRKVFFRPSTGEIVNADKKGDVLIGFQVLANVPNDKLGVLLTSGEFSVVIYVTSTADSGAGSLRAAIAAANDGDVIQFDSTVFPSGTTTAILLASNIAINKAVTINAGAEESPQRVALDAQGAGRCFYLHSDASIGVIGIIFRNASQAGNGGAIYCGSTNPCEFTDCVFDGNAGNTGGGLSATVAADLLFERCTFTNNTASGNGGALYASSSSSLTIAFCEFNGNTSGLDDARRGVYLAGTSSASFNATTLDALFVYTTAAASIAGGIVAVADLTLQNNVVVSISDGAALTVTTAATIGSATLSSDGRGYLSTAAGIDTSAATLNNVVSCSYGAGLETFEIDATGATWTADDLTVPILIERRESDATWTTLSSVATGGSYSDSFEVGTTLRAFDGVRFLVASLDAYWQVEPFVVASNGGGGAGDDSPSWTVQDATITPNVEEV